MKNLLTTIIAITFFVNIQAQVVANDSAETGPTANQMTFYSLKTGIKTTASNTDWHLAVTIQPTAFPNSPLGGTTIRMNEPNGVIVYYVPNANAAAFSTVDTTGYENWTKLNDSDTSIDEGALNSNRDRTALFDFGWGMYNGSSHNVVGDSLYLIKLPTGELKKFLVVNLDKDTAFNLKYSNIDNSNLQTLHISKKDHIGKEFMYLNLSDNVIHDKEPLAADWDLQFLNYAATDAQQGQHIPMVGVWLNKGTLAAKRAAHDVTDNNYSSLTFSHLLNAIGWNWKSQSTSQIEDSLAYFVQTTDGGVYKIVFTGYDLNTGRIYFYKGQLVASGIAETKAESNLFIYPNPANSVLNVAVNSSTATIRMMDMGGRIISETKATGNITQFNTSELANGVYLLTVTANGITSVSRFVISR